MLMATDGMWTMTEDGEFILEEPFKTRLQEARLFATEAWASALVSYLAENSVYDSEFLKSELLRRCNETGLAATEIVNEYVLEALGGDL